MPTDDLKTLLRKGLEPVQRRHTDRFREVLGMLRDTASVVEEFLRRGTSADVSVEVVQGQRADDGLEHRVVVRAPSHGVSDYLLRAYVPLSGYPVVIDSVEEDDVAYRDAKALQGALVELVKKPWFQERLLGLREILRDPALHQVGGVVATVSRAAKKKGG
jgi:hypothetical protein